MSDIVIHTPLDQPAKLPQDKLDEGMKLVDEVLKEVDESHDVESAFAAANDLIALTKITGLMLAKLFHGMNARWKDLGMSDYFVDVAYRKTGYAPDTIRKYIMVWEMLESKQLPAPVAPLLKKRPIKDLIAVAEISKEHSLRPQQWKAIVDASSSSELSDTIRQIRHKPEKRGNGYTIQWKRTGDVWAYHKGIRVWLGTLSREDTGSDAQKELRAQAIARIKKGAGILEE